MGFVTKEGLRMKRLGIHAVALTAAMSLIACRPGEDPARTTTVDPGVGVTDRVEVDRDLQEFVQRATEKNMAEIELGRMAQERAADQQVRQFGQRMVEDHTKALQELRQIAQRHNIQINEQVGDEGRRMQERLQGLKGAEFDREYMSAMVDAHERMHTLVENRAERAPGYAAADRPQGRQPVGTVGQQPGAQQQAGERQPGTAQQPGTQQQPGAAQPGVDRDATGAEHEIDQWAAEQLPIVEQHLQQAEQIHQRLEKTGAGARR
jgi:putative membrane protein